MSLKDWLVRFKAQHEQARAGSLSAEGLADYRAGRDELARALLGAQAAGAQGGRGPAAGAARRPGPAGGPRVERGPGSRGDPGDLRRGASRCCSPSRRPPTRRSRSSSACREPSRWRSGPGWSNALVQPGAVRVSFQFQGMGAAEREQIEFAVFDTVLQSIKV